VTTVLIISSTLYLFLNQSLLYGGVRTFGPLKLGGNIPMGPGDYTFAPQVKIPPSRFYISVVQKNLWCVFEECNPEGANIESLGGWLQGENTDQPEIQEIFGLENNPGISSIIVVGNQEEKIVGIYPNKNIGDVSNVLNIHSKLILKK